MESTHTMAGLLADATAARLRCVAPAGEHATAMAGRTAVCTRVASVSPVPAYQAHWISGALATPITPFVGFGKNRPTRPLSERSP